MGPIHKSEWKKRLMEIIKRIEEDKYKNNVELAEELDALSGRILGF